MTDFESQQWLWFQSFEAHSMINAHVSMWSVYVTLQSISISEQQLCWCIHQTTAGEISFVITTQHSFASLHVQFWVCEPMMERLIVHYMKPKTWSRSKLWGLTDQVETELSLGRTGRGSKGWCGKRSKCRTNSIRGSTDKLLICLLPAGPYKSLLVLHKSDNLL